ncbi:MAG: Rieske 2Fe-2S domain-containing protein [Actinomycetota bacterium]|nr:Rieske 2Fe-2S domain-containing protein [Actinomycetota bacterium]
MDLSEAVWRRFWYPVGFAEDLAAGPVARTVLGQRLVLWDAGNGRAGAALDRCPHRDGPLSQGWTCEGRIVCPYHGWEYSAGGRVARVPQLPDLARFPKHFVLQSVRVEARDGVVWVCLGEPLGPPPAVPGPGPGQRFIREFDEEWASAPARLMENSFDPAHTVFVHRATFGDTTRPDVDVPTVDRTPYGMVIRSDVSVANPVLAQVITGDDSASTVRHTETEFHAPFLRVMRSAYPSGARHQIVTAATPVDDSHLRLVQWAVRNDTEAQAPAAQVVAFDRRVTWEDQELLEGIAAPYSEQMDANVHIKVDRPTIEIRRIYTEIANGTWAGLQPSPRPGPPGEASGDHLPRPVLVP